MPELPDVELYVESLRCRIAGHILRNAVIRSPFLLRTVEPPVTALHGHTATDLRRGGLLANRALSRLLRQDWPRTPEELENLKQR